MHLSTTYCELLSVNTAHVYFLEHFTNIICNKEQCVTGAINELTSVNMPGVFGLHANAEIGYYTKAARDMWLHLIELQPHTGNYTFTAIIID